MDAPNRRDNSRLGGLDYGLMGLASCLVVFSASMSVGSSTLAWFFVYATAIGTGLGFCLRQLMERSVLVKFDSVLYTLAILFAIFFATNLNTSLPDDGFPKEVMMAGRLCWMILLGSVVAWRDGTLLFQAIPAVALFGLVGCYDTYKPAPFLFFGFLICLATMLGRAHRREMMKQAVFSGYFNRADAPNAQSDFPEQSPELYEDIRRGPWRWIAGPEWALGSALAIVVISLFGAPVIRDAVAPISGIVNIVSPPSRSRNLGPGNQTGFETSYTVGRGPLMPLSDKPVYEVSMDRLRYLRTASYDVYTGRGWRSSFTGTNQLVSTSSVSLDEINAGKTGSIFGFAVRSITASRTLPLPAEVLSLDQIGMVRVRPDGGAELNAPYFDAITGKAIESNKEAVDAQRDLPSILVHTAEQVAIPTTVKQFAENAASGGKNDFEKANRVREAIANQCKYNLRAGAVPAERDPAEFFLFDQREGYCDLFATAMVLGARSIDIPARYVIGYLPDARHNDAQGNYIVVEADYHAWAELFFKDRGWVVFDATSGAQEVPNGGVGATSDGNWLKAGWVRAVFNGAFGLLGAGAIFFGLRSRRSAKPKRNERHELERVYVQYSQALYRASGKRRRPGETADEYMAGILESLNGCGEDAQRLNADLVAGLYSREGYDEREIADLRTRVQDLRRKLRKAKAPKPARR